MELISDLEREEFEEKSRRRFRRILLFAVGLGFLIFFLVLSWALMYGGGISFSTGLLGVHSCYMVFYLLFLHSLSKY
jgi:polyferredoxin